MSCERFNPFQTYHTINKETWHRQIYLWQTFIRCTHKFINFNVRQNIVVSFFVAFSQRNFTGNNTHNDYSKLKRHNISHWETRDLSVAKQKCLGMHYLNMILSKSCYRSFFTNNRMRCPTTKATCGPLSTWKCATRILS